MPHMLLQNMLHPIGEVSLFRSHTFYRLMEVQPSNLGNNIGVVISSFADILQENDLSPLQAFRELSNLARSVIVTSGTLSPLDTFASELGATFPVSLEANHVINPCQVLEELHHSYLKSVMWHICFSNRFGLVLFRKDLVM